MTKHLFFLIALALAWTIPMIAFGQNNLQIIRQDGSTEVIRVQPFNTTPETIRIQPYGLNLQPANIPERRFPPDRVSYNPAPWTPGPVTIDNPYYREPEPKPEVRQFSSLRYTLLMIFKRIFRIP